MRKAQNECATTFDLGAWREELGFSLKVTLFFSPGQSFGLVEVLPCSAPPMRGGFDSCFGNIFQNYAEKSNFSWNFREQFHQNHSGASKELLFYFGGLGLIVGRRLQKGGSMFQGSPRGPWGNAKTMCYSLWPSGLRGEVEFLPKSNLVFLPWDIHWAERSPPKKFPTTVGRLW